MKKKLLLLCLTVLVATGLQAETKRPSPDVISKGIIAYDFLILSDKVTEVRLLNGEGEPVGQMKIIKKAPRVSLIHYEDLATSNPKASSEVGCVGAFNRNSVPEREGAHGFRPEYDGVEKIRSRIPFRPV